MNEPDLDAMPHAARPGAMAPGGLDLYECPQCGTRAPWRNGQSVTEGDECDEFWCQTCGKESELSACTKYVPVGWASPDPTDLTGVREALANHDQVSPLVFRAYCQDLTYEVTRLRAENETLRTAAADTDRHDREQRADEGWRDAVDWLLNSRHTADPDIQTPFWARVDDVITSEELRSGREVSISRRRLAAIERLARIEATP